MEAARYRRRLGRRGTDHTPGRAALARLQTAHVTSVPFEPLSITGDPHGAYDGEGVTLSLPAIYEKVVERRRGGFCYELNGLFGWLLGELGYDPTRVAAMIVTDGDPTPPANHLTHLVALDGDRHVVDVGMGTPALRRPVPLDGTAHTDAAGVSWRVVESDRPDVAYALQYREPDAAWDVRFVFDTEPRDLGYFRASCDFLATAPESPFTGEPTVTIATETGHRRLTPDTLVRIEGGARTEEPVAPEDYHDVLAREFGLRVPSTASA